MGIIFCRLSKSNRGVQLIALTSDVKLYIIYIIFNNHWAIRSFFFIIVIIAIQVIIKIIYKIRAFGSFRLRC